MPTLFEIILFVYKIMFGFWPIFLLAVFVRTKGAIKKTLYMWGFWAIIRVIFFFTPKTIPQAIMIPEPMNTILFFVTGVILLLIWIGIIYWKRMRTRRKAFDMTPEGLMNLPPSEFEEMVAELYRAMGHQAKVTGASGDHGIDVVIKAKDGEKWVVQCKRWRTPAGESIVRDFYGTMQHEKAAQGAIIATKGFTQAAIEWAKGKPLHLYTGDDFLKQWDKARKQPLENTNESLSSIDQPIANDGQPNPAPLCPKCGIPMVMRTASQGEYKGKQFFGCRNYPKCREIMPLLDAG